jgi:streptogrisin C
MRFHASFRRRTLRAAGLVAVATVALIACSDQPIEDTPDPEADASEAASNRDHVDDAELKEEDEVAFVREAYGLGDADARLRLRDERWLGETADKLSADRGATFAGAWVDPDARGALHVALAGASSADEATIRAAAPAGRPLEVVPAAFALAELEADRDRVIASGLDGVKLAAIDEETNRIDVHVAPEKVGAVTAALAASLRPGSFSVVSEPRDVTPAACTSRTRCGSPLRGGVRIASPASYCSLGFVGADGDGNRWAITAAHCGGAGSRWSTNGIRIGALGHRRFGGTLDMAAVRVSNDRWEDDPAGYLYNTSTAKGDQVDHVRGRGYVVRGMTLCHAGYRTGRRCGRVLSPSTGYRITGGPEIQRAVWIRACVRGGDSGGPVYRNDADSTGSTVFALAITSAKLGDLDRCERGDSYLATYLADFARLEGVRVRTR